MGCGFADYDKDGRLDLFVSRYVSMDLDHLPEFGKGTGKGEGRGATCQYRGVAVQCGPRGLDGESDYLFHNEGNGRFAEVSQKAGVGDAHRTYGLGIAWFDYNGDGGRTCTSPTIPSRTTSTRTRRTAPSRTWASPPAWR